MGLVDYSSSDGEVERIEEPTAKRRRTEKAAPSSDLSGSALPGLPDPFRDLYAVAPRLSTRDDASLHQGRKRAVPHVEGNWPTHIYLEWTPSESELMLLRQLVDKVDSKSSSKVVSSLVSDLGTPQPLHISLSAPLVLRTEQREDFFKAAESAVNEALKARGDTECPSKQLHLRLAGLKWAANHERTRWFLAAGVERPDNDQLNVLLQTCNDVARSKKLPALYAKPESPPEDPSLEEVQVKSRDYSDRFHFSIGWTLEAPIPRSEAFKAVQISSEERQRLKDIDISLNSLKIKIGNSIRSIPLT